MSYVRNQDLGSLPAGEMPDDAVILAASPSRNTIVRLDMDVETLRRRLLWGERVEQMPELPMMDVMLSPDAEIHRQGVHEGWRQRQAWLTRTEES